jgi:hypothetical protein
METAFALFIVASAVWLTVSGKADKPSERLDENEKDAAWLASYRR